MRYFITGHTGFKGAWLSALLIEQGHEVHGYSHEVRPNSLFLRANLGAQIETNELSNVCDQWSLQSAIKRAAPHRVIHLAAQPIVSAGYKDPWGTFDANISGTANILEASLKYGAERILIATTDKVYRQTEGEKTWKRETDPLGGLDPYSASKSSADIISQSIARVSGDSRVLIARAGNVVGGGDDSADRLLPDIVRAITSAQPITLRNPGQVRPWQHVLDCMSGYLDFLELENPPVSMNFGPSEPEDLTVLEVTNLALEAASSQTPILASKSKFKTETEYLRLNTELARGFGITNVWSQREAIAETIKWELKFGSVDSSEHVFGEVSRYLEIRPGFR